MERKLSTWAGIRSTLILIYAVILMILIPLFFFNYGGDWMRRIADKLPIQERPIGK